MSYKLLSDLLCLLYFQLYKIVSLFTDTFFNKKSESHSSFLTLSLSNTEEAFHQQNFEQRIHSRKEAI